MLGLHLVESRNTAGQLALALVLLFEELAGKVIDKMVVVDIVALLADFDQLADLVGNFNFECQCILESGETILPIAFRWWVLYLLKKQL